MATVSTTVSNSEPFKKFVAEMKKAAKSYVTIGLHDGAGDYESGVSVVQVGLWNEFGTETSPERAWMRITIDENLDKLNQLRDDCVKKIMDGKMTVHQALEKIGFTIQVLLQNKIKSNMPPPNAPSTIAAKKRAGVAPQTLIKTGLMMRSVTYKVFLGG